MKRLFRLSMAVLWLILIFMLFWGCGEDNCSGQNIKDIIVGKWKLLTGEEDHGSIVIYEFKANGQLFTSAISLYPVYLEGNLIHSEVVEESKYYIVDENTIIILGTVIYPIPPYVRDVDLTLSFKYIEYRETIILALVENEADNFILERVK